MKKLFFITVFFSIAFFSPTIGQEQEPEQKIVDFEADIMRPINVGDSSVLNLLGNVVLHHNGAVITCDSAIRYSDRRMDCFHRVVINQGTTYIYGDVAEYNGEINLATVYAPIIKMVDQDAVLYTYNFTFNTLDNIGIYSGTGTMTQQDNLMESERGYYYVDDRLFIGVDSVELRNPDYQMKSDSVSYNLDTEVAEFFTRSYIWNTKDEILSATRGRYFQQTADYSFTSDSYILTDDKEVWADSIDYNSEVENVIMRSNIQIRDEEQKVIAFGDYGEYFSEIEYAMLTRNPSLVSFDPEQPDTLYMRSDSMFMYSFPYELDLQSDDKTPELFNPDEEIIPVDYPSDTVRDNNIPEPDGELEGIASGELNGTEEGGEATGGAEGGSGTNPEGKPGITDKGSSSRETRRERKAARKNQISEVRDNPPPGDNVIVDQQPFDDGILPNEDKPELLTDTSPDISPSDSLTLSPDSLPVKMADLDTIPGQVPVISEEGLVPPDMILTDSTGTGLLFPPVVMAEEEVVQDSLQRVFRGYYNVKIFREDFQAVCDSIVGFSKDSTMHLYIDPVMWNNANQITSDIMDIYSKNQQLDKAVFRGSPFMASEVDELNYNQVKGKLMEAYFRDNEVYRHDVIGNGQTYYYMEDDETKELQAFVVAQCADMSYYFEDQNIDIIIYRWDPDWVIYPIDKIPMSQERFLPGFYWHQARRPSREDVFDRTISDSEREFYTSLLRPLFPLTDKIMTDKERMIQNGIWTERNDTLSEQALEFLESLKNDDPYIQAR